MSIDIKKTDDGKSITIKINGRFDFSLHKDFRDAYKDTPKESLFIIDMCSADYMDSSALGMLLLLREYAGNESAKIKIQGCQPTIKQILAISNFEKLFDIS